VKEAMACNLPIVTTDVGDSREIVGRTRGCFVCRRDPFELAAALKIVLRAGRRTTGRQDIEHLSLESASRRVLALYEGVARKR
jgi:glycosyltransferase involved in cell wall biosynthesis